MSFSYTVGGKSLTHAQQRNQGQNHAKGASNRPKNSSLSSTKSSGTVQRGGKRNSTAEQPDNRGAGASSSPHKAAGTTTTTKPPQTSAIVTLSDVKNRQSKPETGLKSKPDIVNKNNAAIANRLGPGRKLGGQLSSVSKKSASISAAGAGGRIGNQASSQERFKQSDINSEHFYSRTSTTNPKSKSNYPSHVNRTSNRESRSIDPKLKTSPSQSQRSPVRGRGSRGRGSPSSSMAYNHDNSRYTSSSLYSANPRPVGQRRPEDDENRQGQQGEAGPSQGSPQQQQQQQQGEGSGATSGSYRVIQPNASKRQQLITKSQQELKAFEDFKASKKPTTIHGQPQRAGGTKSEEEARQDLEKMHRNKKYEQILKKEERRRKTREREDRENDEKKAKARQVALENERRRKEREDNFLRDEHSKTNNQFLKKLEASKSPPQSGTSISQSPELRNLMEIFPEKKPAKLQELLDITNNDVGKVIDLLTD